MSNALLTTDDVSRILHVGKSTIKRWTEEGKLSCFRTPGGHRKFKVESVQEFIRTYAYDVSISYQFMPLEGSAENTPTENVVSIQQIAETVEMQ